MKLTALEIKKQKFEKSLRGYDPDEVKSFLNVISNEWEKVSTKNRELEQSVENLEDQIEHYKQVESAIHETLQVAKESADSKITGAKKEAEQTIEKAEMKADSIIKEAEMERQNIRQGIRSLQNKRKEISRKLTSSLNVALESVEEIANEGTDTLQGLNNEDEEDVIEDKEKQDKKNTLSEQAISQNKKSSDEEDTERVSARTDTAESISAVPGIEDIDNLVDELD